MNRKLWAHQALSACLIVAILATCSVSALAAAKPAGEIFISGNVLDGHSVTVNGEISKSGRTIFSNSVITTPDNVSATVSIGSVGQIEFSPNTVATVSFDNELVVADITSGKITVTRSNVKVNVTTPTGSVKLSAGEFVVVNAQGANPVIRSPRSGLWLFALVLGGATTGIIFGTVSGNDNQLDGSGSVVSTTR